MSEELRAKNERLRAELDRAHKQLTHIYELALTEDGLADFDADSIRDTWMRYVSRKELDEVEKEIGDFQNEVRDLVIKLSGAPDSAIDGKGSDAGWQEFTLAEIGQGFAHIKEELDRVKSEAAELRSDLLKCREFVARFLVPWKHHLPDSWLDGFVESGCVVFDAVGYVKAKPIEATAGSNYVSKAEVRPIAEELRYWAEGPKHAGDCEFSDKSDEGCWLCMKADRERWPQTSTVMSTARKIGLLEDK